MKILLFNDNPVVRKLVALSAQKTKDDLSVVWSADEIEESEYDLLIIDDALYNDEMFESLTERIHVKSKLLMATRGEAIPAGFDNVINKPFLPTDLVDIFVKIEKKIISETDKNSNSFEENLSPSAYDINLEEALPDMTELDTAEDDFDFGDLEDFDEKLPETAILDKEEVQEVQGLLEDTEEENSEIDEFNIPEEEIALPSDVIDDLSLDDEPVVDEIEDEILNFDTMLENDRLGHEDELVHKELLDEIDFELPASLQEDVDAGDEELLSPFEEIGLEESALEDEEEFGEMDTSFLMDDEELGNLETKIEDAVSGLESEELERELETDDLGLELDDSLLEELTLNQQEMTDEEIEGSGDLDELDMLDERELKRAVGEEIEDDEPLIHAAEGDTSLSAEILDEVLSESALFDTVDDEVCAVETSPHAEGVEALQALLKALSNEDVAKSLKGMNISININFGNNE